MDTLIDAFNLDTSEGICLVCPDEIYQFYDPEDPYEHFEVQSRQAYRLIAAVNDNPAEEPDNMQVEEEPEDSVIVLSDSPPAVKTRSASFMSGCSTSSQKPVSSMQVGNSEEGYVFQFPVRCELVSSLPSDVDGDRTYGTVLKGGTEDSLGKIPFFHTRRNWGHFEKASWKEANSIAGSSEVKVRRARCSSEGVCQNKECEHLQVFGTAYVCALPATVNGKKSNWNSESVGPKCKGCTLPMSVSICCATLKTLKASLENGDAMLLAEHKGLHTCHATLNKGKQAMSSEATSAVNSAMSPVGGGSSTATVRQSAVTQSLQRFIDGESTLDEMLNLAWELSDDKQLSKTISNLRQSKASSNMDMSTAIKFMKEKLDASGMRCLLSGSWPTEYFITSVDTPWSAAEIMVKMHRDNGDPAFKSLKVYMDGGHSEVRVPKHQGKMFVYKICTVLPVVGLLKLAVAVLPGGENHVVLMAFWKQVNLACKLWLRKQGRHREAEGYMFSPSAWVGDSAGGQWLSLRLLHNKHLPLENRAGSRVTNMQTGACLEIDCDLHLEMDLGRMMKKTDDEFDDRLWMSLVKDWRSNALTARKVLEATWNMEAFINQQTNKEVARMCKAWMDFYASERTLHMFRKPEMNKCEVLQHSDKQTMGMMLPLPEWAQHQISSFTLQGCKLEYIGRGGDVRVWTSPVVAKRRDDFHQRMQGVQKAEDLMAQVADMYEV